MKRRLPVSSAEFHPGEDTPPVGSRREFLQLLGASVALAGLAGCTRAPREKIVPYAVTPPEVTPGVPSHYATVRVEDGYARGLVVETHEGRPTKIEGNPSHPASLGGTSLRDQALVLGVYDPARPRTMRRGTEAVSRQELDDLLESAGGDGVHLLLEPTSSPTTIRLLERLSVLYPNLGLHYHAPGTPHAAWAGSVLAYGRPLETHANLTLADRIVAFDCDFLQHGPDATRHARQLAARRRPEAGEMARLYVVEPAMTITGASADHRLAARRSDVTGLLLRLLALLVPGAPAGPPVADATWLAALAADLRAHATRSVILVGPGQPAVAHAAAHLLNAQLGSLAVRTLEPVLHRAAGPEHDLERLGAALDAGQVRMLFVLGGNPVYNAPFDARFDERMRRAATTVVLGAYEHETAAFATWFVPEAHPLESWGDACARNGLASVQQPTLEPLHGGLTVDELLARLAREPERSAHDVVRATWQASRGLDLESFWRAALRTGVATTTEAATRRLPLRTSAILDAVRAWTPAPAGLELCLGADARVGSGEATNNAWLLELPDPITKLTWDNAIELAPATAARLGVNDEDLVELEAHGQRRQGPVLIVPGHAEDAVSLALGYGRRGAETLARDLGIDGYALRAREALYHAPVSLQRLAGTHRLAVAQAAASAQGRDLVRRAPLETFRADPRFAQRPLTPRATLYEQPLVAGAQWGMSIDLSACTGCSVCVIACQAENNTPIVGKEGVLMHRQMHWMRIDRYVEGTVDAPRIDVQPMLCQHCESAPCEAVCPTNATVHSPDGLNEQVYNRCVGTRFCSNGCAWKVRRFNWFNYHELAVRDVAEPDARALHEMVLNPDVTVRARGVMEKCTYCVQRIRESDIRVKSTGTRGDVTPACAQACPSGAIVFGSLTEPGARVAELRQSDRDYAVLDELGTKPRTRYLARVDNPNEEIAK